MPRKLTLSLTLSLMLAAPMASAQDAEENTGPSVRERVEQELEQFRTDLDLTDYQWTQVEMILKSSIRERLAIAQRYGLEGQGDWSNLERKEKRQLAKDMKNSRKATAERMERYLDKEQMKAFKAYQEEKRDQMLARLESAQAN